MRERSKGSLVSIGIVCTCLLQSLSSSAQSASSDAPKDPIANAIAQRAITALGADQITAVEGVIASGTLTLSGDTPAVFPIVMKSRGTAQLRSELTTSKGVRVTIVSNGAGKIVQPDGTIRWLAPENTISQRVTHVPALSLLAEYLQTSVSTQYTGTASVDGSTADVVALGIYVGTNLISPQQQSQNTQQLFYIDHTTGLVLRVQELHYSENVNGETQGLETRYSDYRQVQGVMVPFHQQTYCNGQLLFDLVLSSVSFGASLSDSAFSL